MGRKDQINLKNSYQHIQTINTHIAIYKNAYDHTHT